MSAFSRFYLADRLHPTSIIGRANVASVKNGDWNEINLVEILSDERSPQVGREDLKRSLIGWASVFQMKIFQFRHTCATLKG